MSQPPGRIPDRAFPAPRLADLLQPQPAQIQAEPVAPALAAQDWVVQNRSARRAHLFVVKARRATALIRGDSIELAAPALAWLPATIDGVIRFDAGASGYVVSTADDFLARTIANVPEAVHLRQTLDRLVLLNGVALATQHEALLRSCAALTAEARQPERGSLAILGAHLALICVHLWRLAAQNTLADAGGVRGGNALVAESYSQLVELHYRDNWPIGRYAARLGVTEDRLHSACLRIAGRGPRALLHARLVREACTRLDQLDLPVEQVGYGLGFRDPGYFNRFFRRHIGVSPGAYRRQARADRVRETESYAAWP